MDIGEREVLGGGRWSEDGIRALLYHTSIDGRYVHSSSCSFELGLMDSDEPVAAEWFACVDGWDELGISLAEGLG